MTKKMNEADLDRVWGGVDRLEYNGGSGTANQWKPVDDGDDGDDGSGAK